MGNCKDAPLLPFSSARCPRVARDPGGAAGNPGCKFNNMPLER